jgi:hypothetical protein
MILGSSSNDLEEHPRVVSLVSTIKRLERRLVEIEKERGGNMIEEKARERAYVVTEENERLKHELSMAMQREVASEITFRTECASRQKKCMELQNIVDTMQKEERERDEKLQIKLKRAAKREAALVKRLHDTSMRELVGIEKSARRLLTGDGEIRSSLEIAQAEASRLKYSLSELSKELNFIFIHESDPIFEDARLKQQRLKTQLDAAVRKASEAIESMVSLQNSFDVL